MSRRPRAFAYTGGFLTQARVRRILTLAGLPPQIGLPGPRDSVMVWGHSPRAWRGERIAARKGTPLIRVEDAFLRSLFPGRQGAGPMGLLIDRRGVQYDGRHVSDLELLLRSDPLDDATLLARAQGAMARLREAHLTKYAAVDPDLPLPAPGFVLVADQARDDASILASNAGPGTFQLMLERARADHPGKRIVIKTHPETAQGLRSGYLSTAEADAHLATPVSPYALLDRAAAVYTVSSQIGFEAILAGHRPHVFGQPFYAGWDLSEDHARMPRRGRHLSADQLFAAAMILYPTWYDPLHDRLCDLETVINQLEARARSWREDRKGWQASGMRPWKRPIIQRFFGQHGPVRFAPHADPDSPRPQMVWASKAPVADDNHTRVEDGFLRSRGLGATLTPPMSLVADRKGIHYDPRQPSDLEHWISQRAQLRPDQAERVEHLMARLIAAGLSKYNLPGRRPNLPVAGRGRRVLVVGQVEDDASVLAGAGPVRSNLELLRSARREEPDAQLIYKPHPDVEAGLRTGAVDPGEIARLGAHVAHGINAADLINEVGTVWTMTSLLGFEALLRRREVVVLGAPFYAGWGLTVDLGTPPARRTARPSLLGLAHAALIDYPRYVDPVSGQPCPVELIVDRLTQGADAVPHPLWRLLGLLFSAQATGRRQRWTMSSPAR
ncbi:MAG: capsular polysaccharide biosynthesis protein [Marinibacterium sp.]|nr:capsular polysaccharide biosynthesis protein [Marinibacterium sp.]